MKVIKTKLFGRDVFATEVYSEGDKTKSCPVIRLSDEDRLAIDKTEL